MMFFKYPLVLALIPVFIVFLFWLRKTFPEKTFIYSSDYGLRTTARSLKVWLSGKIVYLRFLAVILIITAIARPQIDEEVKSKKEGIAIMIAIDCSSTMLAEDLALGGTGLARLVPTDEDDKRINRIDAVKEVARDFTIKRKDDLVGVTAFAAQAYVLCPPTYDTDWLKQAIDRIEIGMIRDATSIGSGILSSLNALKNVKARSKIVVLLTDGINNYGKVPPLVAANAARTLGIKIYTIGIVSRGQTPFPFTNMYGQKEYKDLEVDIDEDLLKKIADVTGGEYYRVNDLNTLRASYDDIDKLEKMEIENKHFAEYRDIYYFFVSAAILLLLIEGILCNTILRRIP